MKERLVDLDKSAHDKFPVKKVIHLETYLSLGVFSEQNCYLFSENFVIHKRNFEFCKENFF